MADTWILITPAGSYQLNPTFSAPQYEPGDAAGQGLIRHPNTGALQREGDSLRTPGPLILTGRVGRDDHDATHTLAELNHISAAAEACVGVARTTRGGTYTFGLNSGGPTPEVISDRLGSWVVRLYLWPASPEPAFSASP